MRSRHKRRSYFLKNSAQGRFIVRFVILSLLGGTMALAVFNLLARKKIDNTLYSIHIPKISAGGLLWNEMLCANTFVIVFTLAAFAITAKGLFTRIHGPLKKMTNDLSQLAAGDLTLIVSLREKDEFREVAGELNRMTAGLRKRLAPVQELTERLVASAEALQENPGDEAARAGLARVVAELRQATGAFSL